MGDENRVIQPDVVMLEIVIQNAKKNKSSLPYNMDGVEQ